MNPTYRNLFLLPALVLLVACASRPPIAPTPKLPPKSAAPVKTTLSSGDEMQIQVFGEKDLTGKFQVSDDGTIDYPLVGRLAVKDLTPPQVATLIRKKLAAGLIRDPHVSVFVQDYKNKRNVVVWGQVKSPGTYNYVEGMTIINGLTKAGGLTALANETSISITRLVNGKSKTFTIAVREGDAANYPLKGGDVVFVPERIF